MLSETYLQQRGNMHLLQPAGLFCGLQWAGRLWQTGAGVALNGKAAELWTKSAVMSAASLYLPLVLLLKNTCSSRGRNSGKW